MIANLVRVLLILLGALIVVPGLLGLALAGTAHQNKRFLAALGGLWTQVAFGGLGIIVHELSHLLLALVFHHQVKRVALLRIPRGLGIPSSVTFNMPGSRTPCISGLATSSSGSPPCLGGPPSCCS